MAKAKVTGKVNLGGRPREHNREQIALDLIEWAKKQDSINVNKFCAFYEPPFACQKLSEWSKQDTWFRESYDIAKTFLAFRREEWVSKDMLHVKAYDLSAAAYDHIVKEEKRAHAEFESSLKSKEQVATSADDLQRAEALMNQLSSLQSARKKACSQSKTDDKS